LGFRVSSKQKIVWFLRLPYSTTSQLTCSSSLQVVKEISEKPTGFYCFSIFCWKDWKLYPSKPNKNCCCMQE